MVHYILPLPTLKADKKIISEQHLGQSRYLSGLNLI
jgi:hypothetical protein